MKERYNIEFAVKTIKRLWPQELPRKPIIQFVDGSSVGCIALPLDRFSQPILTVPIKDIGNPEFPAHISHEIAHYFIFLGEPRGKPSLFESILKKINSECWRNYLYNIALWLTGRLLQKEWQVDKKAIEILTRAGYEENLYLKLLQKNLSESRNNSFPERTWTVSLAQTRLRKFQKK